MATIACMVLFKNERHHLERIVPKILAAFDQAIFVTNQEPNTDGSDELLARYGVAPHRIEWREDFAQARQAGLDQSRCDYTLWMDCDDDLITDLGSFEEAGRAARSWLEESGLDYYMHRVYFPQSSDYWLRENWFHQRAGVRVKYPVHEVYQVTGSSALFPAGILDRVNDPLRPDYARKLWRYYDMLYRYLKEVDPADHRCRFYLAREFQGPPPAKVALLLDFLEVVVKDEGYRCFGDECLALMQLFELRSEVQAATLLSLSEQILLRYPFELLAQVLYCMIRCELTPDVPHALRFYDVMAHRAEFETDRTPFSQGWYYGRSINACGYYLFRVSVLKGSAGLAQRAVEVLSELTPEECSPDVADLIAGNLRLARTWLRGFGPGPHPS